MLDSTGTVVEWNRQAEVFDLMTKWIDRYRQQAQERYERLDAVLAEMQGDRQPTHSRSRQQGAAS